MTTWQMEEMEKPFVGAGKEEEYVLAVLREYKAGNGYLSGFFQNPLGGPWVQRFEAEFAKYIGVEHAIAVSSGTAALHVAQEAIRLPSMKGARVLTSPLTFVASASSIYMAQNFPVFCDISPRTLNMEPTTYRGTGRDAPSYVIAVHLLGHPCAMHNIESVFGTTARVIEDCAQSLGAKYRDKMTGAVGDIGCFSSSTRILTPKGPVRIRDVRIGDEVLTPHGPKRVRLTHKRQYEGDWVLIRFGKMDSSFKLRATAEHPIYAYRDGRKDWLPIAALREGDEIFVPTNNCQMCNSLIPFYRKFCNTCYHTQSEKHRALQRKLHLKTGERLRISSDKHWEEDVKPIAAKFSTDGFRVVPLIRPEPDFLAIKGEKVLAVEVESKVSPRISKLEQYIGDKRFDDIVWVTQNKKTREESYGHASYAIDMFEDAPLARVPILSVTKYALRGKHVKRPVYNLTVEGSPTYFAKFVLVHNCFSFQQTKSLTTLGEGGMLVTDSDIYADNARQVRNHGEKYMKGSYLGYNYRMTEAAAAYGLGQLERLPETMKEQVACAEIVRKNLPEGLAPLPVESWASPSFFIVGATIESLDVEMAHSWRHKFIDNCMKTLGFTYPKPGKTIGPGYSELITDLPYFKRSTPYYNWEFPVARHMMKKTVWFDVHRFTTIEAVEERMEKLKSVKLGE